MRTRTWLFIVACWFLIGAGLSASVCMTLWTEDTRQHIAELREYERKFNELTAETDWIGDRAAEAEREMRKVLDGDGPCGKGYKVASR